MKVDTIICNMCDVKLKMGTKVLQPFKWYSASGNLELHICELCEKYDAKIISKLVDAGIIEFRSEIVVTTRTDSNANAPEQSQSASS